MGLRGEDRRIEAILRKLRAAASDVGKGNYFSAYRHILAALYLLEECMMSGMYGHTDRKK